MIMEAILAVMNTTLVAVVALVIIRSEKKNSGL